MNSAKNNVPTGTLLGSGDLHPGPFSVLVPPESFPDHRFGTRAARLTVNEIEQQDYRSEE